MRGTVAERRQNNWKTVWKRLISNGETIEKEGEGSRVKGIEKQENKEVDNRE